MDTMDKRLLGALATLGLLITAILHTACDEENTPKTAVPAASGSAASSDQPTPEKVAGVEYGTVKLCVVPKGGASPPELSVIVSPIFVKEEQSKHEQTIALKKGEKGYCDFVRFDWGRWWGNAIKVQKTDVELDEVGVYYLKDWKANPGADALTYAKAVRTDEGAYELGVLIASATIPVIQIVVKE